MNMIDIYIREQEAPIKAKLQRLILFLLGLMPAATETFSYKTATFKLVKNIIHFAVYKTHIGIYPGVEAMVMFHKEIALFKHTKGGFQIPLYDDIPYDLIRDMVLFNLTKHA